MTRKDAAAGKEGGGGKEEPLQKDERESGKRERRGADRKMNNQGGDRG